MPIVSARSQPIPVNGGASAGPRPRVQIIRNRTMSISSTGSSPPNSASPTGSPRQRRSSAASDKSADSAAAKFEFSLTMEQAASGNIMYTVQSSPSNVLIGGAYA